MTRVWVTRDESPDGPLGTALREAGLEPIHEPVIERTKQDDARDELNRLRSDDWLVLTSTFTVDCLTPESIDVDYSPRVIAVGEETAAAARRSGWRVDETTVGGAAELFDRLRERITQGTICYPRSSLAKPPEAWGCVSVISPVVYETTPRAFDRSVIERVDVAAVTSPSAVRAIGRVSLPLASIGPTTTKAIRELGMEAVVQADQPSFGALVRAIAKIGR